MFEVFFKESTRGKGNCGKLSGTRLGDKMKSAGRCLKDEEGENNPTGTSKE